MTTADKLLPCPFDPSLESNWHFHDEYEFWYIEFPEILKPDAKYKIDLARERGFKPWEEYKQFSRAPSVDLERVKELIEQILQFEKITPFAEWRLKEALALLDGDGK